MTLPPLSRREREIMEILYAAEGLTAADVRERMTDAPSYSAVRALLRVLEDKGHVAHEQRGAAYVYAPVVSRTKARKSALKSLVHTFFDDSPAQAVAALLEGSSLDAAELDRLATLIAHARKEGR